MAPFEHERKFRVADASILRGSTGVEIEQGYLWANDGWALRARRTYSQEEGRKGSIEEGVATLTLKGPRIGQSRPEYELQLDPEHAASLIEACQYTIHKTRYPIISEELTWEVDVFHALNRGLIIAEIEMRNPDQLAAVRRPWWAIDDVTMDERYANENLAKNPWTRWLEWPGE